MISKELAQKRLHIKYRICGCLAIAWLTVLPLYSSHSAEPARAIPSNGVSETFDIAPQSSGLPLVGLRLIEKRTLSAETRIDLSNVIISLPDVPVAQVCVRVTTQDARYVALNPYKIESGSDRANSAILDPVSVKYIKPLKRYLSQQFALKAYVPINNGCSPVDAMHLPELRVPANLVTDQIMLEIKVNSRGRDTQAVLMSSKGSAASNTQQVNLYNSVRCESDRALAGLAYDKTCRLLLKAYASFSGNAYTLELTLNDGFDDVAHAFSVYLPKL